MTSKRCVTLTQRTIFKHKWNLLVFVELTVFSTSNVTGDHPCMCVSGNQEGSASVFQCTLTELLSVLTLVQVNNHTHL